MTATAPGVNLNGTAAHLAARLAGPGRHIVWGVVGGKPSWVTVPGDLTEGMIDSHLDGRAVYGAYPAADDVARSGCIDIDLHLEGDRQPTAEEVARNEQYAVTKSRELDARGVANLLTKCHEAGSYHIDFNTAPIGAARLGRWLKEVTADAASVGVHVDTYPSEDGGGNAVRIPGRHHKRPDHWSLAWDGSVWEPWPAAILRLADLPNNPPRVFPDPGKPQEAKREAAGGGARPGDVLNLLVPIETVLTAYGWQVEREDGVRVRWTRPGKDGGVSASVMGGTVWVFSSSVPGLPVNKKGGKPYTAFALIAYLEFEGDFKVAARGLAEQGFCPPPENESEGAAEPWPAAIPLTVVPVVPPFPTDVLPPWLREWAVAQAEELQVPPDLPALLGLGLVGGGIGRKVAVQVRDGFGPEPANLYVMAAMAPAERKTQTFRKAVAPVQELERQLREDARPLILEAESKRRVAEGRVKHWEGKLAKLEKSGDAGEREAIDNELKDARTALLNADVPAVPLLYTEDDTPAALKSELIRQGGRMMVASTEAKCLENITQFTEKPDFDVFLKAHAGDELKTGRVGRGREAIEDPALTCVLSPQPVVLQGLAEDRVLRDRGFLARWLYSLPESKVGSRKIAAPSVPAGVREKYRRLMTKVWKTQYATAAPDDPDAIEPEDAAPKLIVRVLPFDPEADATLAEFERWIEPRLGPGGELSATAGWGGKLVGLCVRLSAALHVADGVGDGRDWAAEAIPAAVVRRAIWLCREYLIPHAAAAFDLMGANATVAGARRVWKWVADAGLAEFSKRDCFHAHRAAFDTVDEMQPCLDLLERHYLIRPKPTKERPGPGRKPTPVYEANPHGSDPNDGPDPSPTPPPKAKSAPWFQRATGGKTTAQNRSNTPTRDVPPTEPAQRPATPAQNAHNAQNCPGEGSEPNSAHCAHSARGVVAPDAVLDTRPSDDGPTEGQAAAVPHEVITTPDGLARVVAAVGGHVGAVAVDTETTGLRPHLDRVRLLQVGAGDATFVIDLFALPDPAALAGLFAALARTEVVGHNLAAFDLPFLARLGFTPSRVFDCLLASHVVYSGETGVKHGLGEAVERELGAALDKSQQKSNWSRAVLTPAQLAYAAADVAHLVPLADALRRKAADRKLTDVLELEMRCAVPLAAMAVRGIGFDSGPWVELAGKAEAERDALLADLDGIAPNPGTLTDSRNWRAVDQIIAAFKGFGVELEDTEEETLAGVDDPPIAKTLAAKILAFRGADKRAGSYGREFVEDHAPAGRVFARWNQCGAKTGRMACSEPNLQQVPHDPAYRRCFTARPGNVLVKCDYSQIELRIAAAETKDAAMLAAYRDGIDLHRLTAAKYLRVPVGDVTKDARQAAKEVNFGAIYGLGPKSLRKRARVRGLDMTDAEARGFLDAFFAQFSGVSRWHDRLKRNKATEVRTRGGRRVAVEPDQFYGAKANYIVQGTGGDGIKRALVLLYERRAEFPEAVPVLVVHDEVVVECPAEQAGGVESWVKRAMVDAMRPLVDPVSVEVEATTGKTWGGD